MTGTAIGPAAPTILRWHIPFVPEKMGTFARRLVVKGMESFDAVWAKRNMFGASPDPIQAYLGLRGLKTLGLRMKAHNRGSCSHSNYGEDGD